MNKNPDKLAKEIIQRLNGPIRLYANMANIAAEIFYLKNVLGCNSEVMADVMQIFHQRIVELEFDEILNHQMQYANRLIGYKGKLEFEEINKIKSICDEIHALKMLDFKADDEIELEFKNNINKISKNLSR